jgi:hypothetical protein
MDEEKRKEEFRKWLLDRFRNLDNKKEISKENLETWDDLNRWVQKNGDKWDKFLRDLTIPEF